MKMSRVFLTSLLTLVASLSSESDLLKLDSINDLIQVFADNSVPLHSLLLLYWFANGIDIDNNNVSCITFNPRRDTGSHRHGYTQGFLPQAFHSSSFTVGYLNKKNASQSAHWQPSPSSQEGGGWEHRVRGAAHEEGKGENQFEEDDTNMDAAIITCIHPERQQFSDNLSVTEAYLSYHLRENDRGKKSSLNRTFTISTDLLQQIRLFSPDNTSPTQEELRDRFDSSLYDTWLEDLSSSWPENPRLGLFLLIIDPENRSLRLKCKAVSHYRRSLAETMRCEWQNCDYENLPVRSGGLGEAMICWRSVPEDLLNVSVALALFRNDEDQGKSLKCKKIRRSMGGFHTSVPLNEGLQLRLYKACPSLSTKTEEICRGKEFKSPKAVSVTDYAQLQLFVREGKACFRLYIKKHHHQWESDFYYSWIGLYMNDLTPTKEYLSEQWQWATKFKQGLDSGHYKIFEYCTGTALFPDLQARFMIRDHEEKARTPPWSYLPC